MPRAWMLAAALLVTACSPLVKEARSLTEARWTNVQEASYDAADKLVMSASPRLPKTAPIVVGTLSDVNNIENSSTLGRIISEQVGARLTQLGYDVREVRLRDSVNVRQFPKSSPASGEFVTSRNVGALVAQANAGAVVTGTYAEAEDDVMVNIRLVDPSTGKVAAAHDFGLAKTPDVRALLAPGPQKSGKFFTSGFWRD